MIERVQRTTSMWPNNIIKQGCSKKLASLQADCVVAALHQA
jgi:hypothetical protein